MSLSGIGGFSRLLNNDLLMSEVLANSERGYIYPVGVALRCCDEDVAEADIPDTNPSCVPPGSQCVYDVEFTLPGSGEGEGREFTE